MIIYDLQGNVVDTLQEEEVGLGAGSLDWDEDLPAEDGIYTYKIIATHQDMLPPMGPCEDLDKSPRLTISNVSVSDFEWIDLPTAAQVTLGYQLNRASANCRLRVFNHELDEVTVTAPAGGALSNTVGTHSFTVEFEDPDQIVGNYRFVVLADETANDGALNRDEQPKPATQKSTAMLQWPSAVAAEGGGIGTGNYDLADVVGEMGTYDEELTRYTVTGYVCPSAKTVRDDLEDSAIAYLRAHSTPTLMLFGDGSSELRGDTGEDNEQDDIYYVRNIDGLDHMLFALCMGCSTAASGGGVPSAIVDEGAKCAMGFTTTIYSPQGWTFSYHFFKEALAPGATVWSASNYALSKVLEEHGGDYGGTSNLQWIDSGTVQDPVFTSLTLRPARWGQ